MSDQPKPITGEWTSHTAYNLYRKDDGFYSIADAHNAALAAEREHGQQECDRLDAFWQNQLAAEREKVKELEQLRTLTLERYLTNEQKRTVKQLREQLGTVSANAVRKIDKLNQQLAAAQAEIRQHNNALAFPDCHRDIPLGDTTALDAAIAAAQKPLVDAGREALVALATLKITDTEKPYAEISPTLRHQILKAHDLLVTALATVKEGK